MGRCNGPAVKAVNLCVQLYVSQGPHIAASISLIVGQRFVFAKFMPRIVLATETQDRS